jgi:hypothetical protein
MSEGPSTLVITTPGEFDPSTLERTWSVASPVAVNVAVQFLGPFIVTAPSEQSESPDQPAKVEPAAGVWFKITGVP